MKIIFVYNADSGFVSSLLDIGHKVISPDTYSCNLCKMIYGVISEREEWKKYRESSKDEMEFLHKDEFEIKYKDKREYPVILKMNDENELEELISKEELEKMKSVSELINKINKT